MGESGCGRNRAAERIGRAQGNYKKWVRNCARGVWGHAPRKFMLLKRVLGASEVVSQARVSLACTQYI